MDDERNDKLDYLGHPLPEGYRRWSCHKCGAS
jgi:hypothetical protein